MVILVAVLLGCLLFMLCTVAGSSFKSIASPAGDLLDKPIDPFLQDKVPTPPRGFQPKQQPKQPAREPELPATQPVLPAGTSGSGLFSGSASIMSNIFGGGPITHLPEYREHLMPEMLVQEPEGMQVFIDGELTNRERNGYCEVWRSAGARDAKKVMKLTFCEGTSGPHGHQNGISLEIMDISKMPVAYLNTQFAIDRPGHMSKHALSPKRHITIFDTFTESVDFHQPFATAEREARGVTLRRVSNGEVICVVASGGYNTDFGNITDASGRLIATSSNRGANLFGIGMVHGSWTQDRRSLTISQGTDVAMIVCAIVCTAKLS